MPLIGKLSYSSKPILTDGISISDSCYKVTHKRTRGREEEASNERTTRKKANIKWKEEK